MFISALAAILIIIPVGAFATTNPPQIFIYQPENKTYDNELIPINITAYDDNSPFFTLWINVSTPYTETETVYYNESWENATFIIDIQPIPNITITLDVFANDTEGNFNSSSVTYTGINMAGDGYIPPEVTQYIYECHGNWQAETIVDSNPNTPDIVTLLDCPYGCDEMFNVCSPPPIVLLGGICVGIFIIIGAFALIKRWLR